MASIFICSPYRGDIDNNRLRALQHAREVALGGDVPIAPHLYFPHFLDDAIEEERHAGIMLGIELLKRCDKVHVYGDTITEGMKKELQAAIGWGIPVERFRDG